MMFTQRTTATIAFFLLVVGLTLWAPAPANAGDLDGDLRVGVYTDASESFVGAGLLTSIGGAWMFNPNVEWVFLDNGDLATINADFHYDLDAGHNADFWLGAGPALVLRENRFGKDETDVGLNLLAGVGFLLDSPVRPYIQGKILLSDETEGVIAFGIRFG